MYYNTGIYNMTYLFSINHNYIYFICIKSDFHLLSKRITVEMLQELRSTANILLAIETRYMSCIEKYVSYRKKKLMRGIDGRERRAVEGSAERSWESEGEWERSWKLTASDIILLSFSRSLPKRSSSSNRPVRLYFKCLNL